MFLPRYFTSSTCGLKRRPSHCSQGTNTSARNCISTRTSPSPWHASHRPPGTLNEKWLGVSPRDLASLVDANSSRMGSNALRYVTGFDRGVRPIGVWSTSTTSLTYSWPSSRRVRADLAIPIALGALQGRVQHVVDQRGLAGSADAGDAGERVERDLDVDALQVVLGRAEQPDALRSRPCGAPAAPEWPVRRAGTSPSASAARSAAARACPRKSRGRRARRRRAPCRRCSRRRRSCRRRARRRARCCPGRAAGEGCRSAAGCRACAGRSTARPARTASRPAPTQATWPG